MKIELKHIGIFMLTFACLGGVGSAQDLTLEFDGDKSLINDVEIDIDRGLPRVAPDQSLINDVDVQVLPPAPGQPGDRWIGVGVAPIPEVLRSHLNVGNGIGVMVDQVVPNSPAANAGLKRHDVLISAGGSAVSNVQDLVNSVADVTGDGSLELKWIRGGQEMTSNVVPADRPQTMRLGQRRPAVDVDPQDIGRLRDWLGRLEQGGNGNFPGRMRMRTQPGSSSNSNVFQNSMSVQIHRNGNGPAKINVTKDGDSWELTEDDLGALPAEVRTQVESMLNGGGLQLGMGQLQGLQALQGLQGLQALDGLPDIGRMMQDLDGRLKGIDGFDTRFDEMNSQMQRMFEQMQELRSQQQRMIPAEDLEQGDEA